MIEASGRERLRGRAQKPNISELAGEFHVDRKTIRRDLQDLVQHGQLDPAVYPLGGDENGASEPRPEATP